MKKINFNRKLRRKIRISANIFGTADNPRVSVFRSNKYIYAQVIDDAKRVTLAFYCSRLLLKDKNYKKENKTNEAKKTGQELAKILKAKGINKVIFDRSLYAYQGRVKALADGLKEEGVLV
jgi:large subunit ribosomal protein L18